MKLFKKLFLFIAIMAALGTHNNQAMEKPALQCSEPTETYSPEDFKITANLGNTEIGYIEYTLERRKATILRFEVQKNQQNKEHRAGQHLFQACVDHVVQQGYPQLEWTANPIPTNKLDLATICTIYQKIVQRLNNASSYKLVQGKEVGMHNPSKHMKLIFDN